MKTGEYSRTAPLRRFIERYMRFQVALAILGTGIALGLVIEAVAARFMLPWVLAARHLVIRPLDPSTTGAHP